jgi:hypothetical protein
MRTAAILILATLVASPVAAQGRGRSGDRVQGVPPGHMPPPGQCRVWHDGRPPGQQPRPTSCREAERVASRDRSARVIYGSDQNRNNGGLFGRDQGPFGRGRAIPRDDRSRGVNSVPFENGYRDGLEKGREDLRDRDSYDPVRHSRYRSADRGYNQRYGTKEQYKLIYREGFEDGYAEAYRGYGIRGRLPGRF